MTGDSPPRTFREVLAWLHDALDDYESGEAPMGLHIGHMTAPERVQLAEVLGDGEVAVHGTATGVIRETRFPGVWFHLASDGTHAVRLEVGVRPTLAMDDIDRRDPGLHFAAAAEDLMNGPAVLAEIEQQQATYRRGGAAHTVNLSRLPVTPGDRAFLDERLGEGEVTMRVRGYGETRITATKLPNVWWVRHYNASEQLLLDSVEVSDFPTVACATPEDLADSAARLSELIAGG
jgi:hydrogenase-1 operon protein HyaF